MKFSQTVAKIQGIEIELHWSFLLLMAFIFLVGGLGSLLVLAVIFGSVMFHELSHSLVSKKRGVSVRKIMLLPIGGVAMIEELALPPKVELEIAVAGPVFNFAAAAVSFALLLVLPEGLAYDLAGVALHANLVIGAFNLLPALPMDGGRIWRSMRQEKVGYLRATREAASLSQFVIGMFIAFSIIPVVVFGAWGLLIWNAVIAYFVFNGSEMEKYAAEMRAASEGVKIADVMRKPIVVDGNATLLEAYELLFKKNARAALVYSKGKIGVIDIESIAGVKRESWGRARVMFVAKKARACAANDRIFDVLKFMRMAGAQALPVVHGKKVVGMVLEPDIMNKIEIGRSVI